MLRCGVDGPCQNAGSRTIAIVLLSAPGEYRAMVITPGSEPLRDPVGFDEDARLAKEAGAAYDLIEPIVVY